MRTEENAKEGIECCNRTGRADVRRSLLAEALELIAKLSAEQLTEIMEGII